MYLTGNDLWPFTDAKQAILVSALYDHIQVKPIDIRVTKDSLEASKRRRQLRRQLLQVRALPHQYCTLTDIYNHLTGFLLCTLHDDLKRRLI